jgi:hypothetical protein
MLRFSLSLSPRALWVALVWTLSAILTQAAEPVISFDRDIRPILSDTCYQCHGPDSVHRQAGLRLDRAESATAEADSGARAIVPGDPAASEMIARIVSDDPDVVMPPPQSKLGKLAPEQVELLKRWVAAGAVYEPHWAFQSLKNPVVPEGPATVQPIDRIVGKRLAERGLAAQPEADRVTLIRRATFDITGLPPTPDDVAAFVADDSPQAYEKLLDRLLASPRYGERMAADWLDLARYADSYGFQVDRDRPMWWWRDWVIGAFNRNLPWDDFVTWQLAGDLLPNASDEQILATAFNRLHQQEAEGGSVEEEYRVNHVNDRVTTFGTAFLGLTLECCRCHDHKFDPLTQKEYYQLFAFFDDVDEAGLYSYFTPAVPTPKLRLADDAWKTAMQKADEACRLAATEVARRERLAGEKVLAWIAGKTDIPADLAAVDPGKLPGRIAAFSFDDRAADNAFPNAVDGGAAATSPAEITVVPGHSGAALKLTGDHPVQTAVGNFRRSQPFSVALWLEAPVRYDRAVVFHRSQAWTDAGSRGYELLVEEGHFQWSLIHFWPGDAASVRSVEPVPVGRWTHLVVTSDGSGAASGLKLFIDGRPAAVEIVRDSLTREITGGGGDHIRIGERMRDQGFKGGLVDEFQVYDRALSALEARELFAPGTFPVLKEQRPDGAADLLAGFHAAALDADVAAARKALEAARRARDDLGEQPQEIMVMREMATPKTAYVLTRGDYDKRGDAVGPDTPAVLPPFPPGEPRNRLGLARWLTDPANPLLARVTVNRLWQSLFGVGIVKSPEDLGLQSVRPEYPELLDTLAWQFSRPRADGGLAWDMKALMRTIMLSETYRQRSTATEQLAADDPANGWLARGPRHRLPAEMIRDGILASCGLLVEQTGGPPVSTYDLAESFKPATPGTGADLYRRSLYTLWRRSGPGPVLESFDVPKRAVCVARRDTTNTSLHALVLLNGPQFVEAARVLAQRTLSGSPPAERDVSALLAAGFERLTLRRPDEAELGILRAMHAEQLAWYTAHPDDAVKLLAVGSTPADPALEAVEVAALAEVFNALISYDGTVVKR